VAWQETTFEIEDEDLMFDGVPLNRLYEENREEEGRRSSGESEREERRGRRRESRK